MNKINKNYYILVASFIAVIVQSRLVPHASNFTPVLATGIFCGFYFKNFYSSFLIILISMFVGDLYLGFHNTMFFTYIALAIPVALGVASKFLKIKEILFSGVISSVAFFLITNLGAWITLDIYEKNLSGLMNSYILAIPFFHNTLLSTLLFLFLFKILFELILNKKTAD